MKDIMVIVSWAMFGLADLATVGWFVFIFVNLFLSIMAWWIPLLATFGCLILCMVFLVTLLWAAN